MMSGNVDYSFAEMKRRMARKIKERKQQVAPHPPTGATGRMVERLNQKAAGLDDGKKWSGLLLH
jgi:hypothetical protein